MMDVFIKNVDRERYKLAKMIAAGEEKTMGQVFNEAIDAMARVKGKKGFASLKSFDFGPGTENLSMEVDKILNEVYK